MFDNVLRAVFREISAPFIQTTIKIFSTNVLSDTGGIEGNIRALFDGALAEPFSKEPGRFVHYIKTSQGNYYLKRSTWQSPRSVLRHLLRGRSTHTDAVWEGVAVQTLGERGFHVMQPVAWGEEMLLGIWPLRGFLLIKEVIGRELTNLFAEEQDSNVRGIAFEAMGRFIGKLHGAGFFHSPRIRDYIVVPSFDKDSNQLSLTMIDVDFKGLSLLPQSFETRKAIGALVVSCHIYLRTGHSLSRFEARNFIRGYRNGLRNFGQSLAAGYLKELVKGIDVELAKIQQDSKLRKEYPRAYRSVDAGITC